MIVIVLLSVHKAERPRRSNHFAAWTISQNAAVLHSGQGLGFALCFKKHAALVTMSIVVCKHHFPTFTICISMHYFLPFLLLPPHRGGKIDVASVLTRVQSFFQAMYNRLDLDLVLWWCSSSYFYSLNSQAGLEPTTFWLPVRRSNHWAIRIQMAERRLNKRLAVKNFMHRNTTYVQSSES